LWFKIVAQYWDDVFESEDIYTEIYYILDIWDKIDVYIDDSDHSKYWMDVDTFIEKNSEILKITIK
jgi:hypothetical protein